MDDTKYHIGCSGYYYSYWKNRFYPGWLPAKNWLAYYSTLFDTVELNGTFYSTPRLSTLQNYVGQTPAHFRFSAKMNKYITHILRLKDCRARAEEYCHLLQEGLVEKLGCILFQLPPSFHFNEENLSRVLNSIPASPYHVVEFRHISWWTPGVKQELQKAGISFCNVDYPKLENHIIQTSDVFYFRFHGSPELFKSFYTDETLRQYILKFPKNCRQYYVYFNNTYYEAGYTNAHRLKEMLGLINTEE